ncbi:isocitrate lyase/PEP mutase family protein [Dictyobacter halimunensis]
MESGLQKERARRFRSLHQGAPMLVLPNVWDAASAQVIEQVGFPAIATTSSGVAAALGYEDGQRITREMLVEALARITRVVNLPVTADIEAGFGSSIAEVLQTVREAMATGVVGINIEDSRKQPGSGLVDMSYQVELLTALRELATELDVPFVINARVDVFLLKIGEPEDRFEHAVRRANAYLRAGADCVYPIAHLDYETIGRLVQAIDGPINIMGGRAGTTLAELERLGVARVSLADSLMDSMLAHLRAVAVEVLEHGSFEKLNAGL